MNYDVARAAQRELEADLERASQAWGAIRARLSAGLPVSPMGLTPDVVKRAPGYRAAVAAYDAARKRLRAFNGPFLKEHGKRFAADTRRERDERREAKLQPSVL